MKTFFKTVAAAAALALAATTAIASDWTPSGPIKMLIGFRAGGGADTQARLIGEALEAKKKVSLKVILRTQVTIRRKSSRRWTRRWLALPTWSRRRRIWKWSART